MADDKRIRELLNEILDSDSAPEEACAQSPELLPEVYERLKQVRCLEDQLDELFPSSSPAAAAVPGSGLRSPEARLPRIDGYDVQRVLGYGGMGVGNGSTR